MEIPEEEKSIEEKEFDAKNKRFVDGMLKRMNQEKYI